QRSAPVLAFPCWHPRGGMVCRRIEPGVFTVNEKHVLFGRLVIPAHPTGMMEVGASRLLPDQFSVVAELLEKHGRERFGGPVARLKQVQRFAGVGARNAVSALWPECT